MLRLLLVFIILSSFIQFATANTYKWTDKEGNVTYSDVLPADTTGTPVYIDPPPSQQTISESNQRLNKTLFELELMRQKGNQKKQAIVRKYKEETDSAKYCFDIRADIGTLKQSAPVYLDEYGDYHVQWRVQKLLVYEGKRTYLNDEERALQIERFNKKLNSNCKGVKLKHFKPDPHEAMIRLAKECRNAKLQLEKIQSPDLRTVDNDIAPYKRAVQFYCNDKK